MSAISTTGARIDRWDNGRPAHREQARLIEVKLERSSRYLCSEGFITFISKLHDDDAALILAPYRQIFISYRRADTLAISGHVYDQLRQAFDADRVFFDVDTIPAGVDFRDHIAECMDLTPVCVAVVGHRWRRRPIATRLLRWGTDHVHVEIGLALEAGIPIIPVLVDGAPMPTPKQLPKSLEPFCYLNATHVGHGTIKKDLDRLTLLVAQHTK